MKKFFAISNARFWRDKAAIFGAILTFCAVIFATFLSANSLFYNNSENLARAQNSENFAQNSEENSENSTENSVQNSTQNSENSQNNSANNSANFTQISLEKPAKIDENARAKYLENQRKIAEEKIAAEKAAAEKAKIAAENSLNNNARNSAKNPANSRENSAQNQTNSANQNPQIYNYNRLIIPKIGLNAPLATVGLLANNQIDTHASLPAIFSQSSAAGTNTGKYSATFVDGHNPGIFSRLGNLAAGDQITISLANGAGDFTYTVCATEISPLQNVDMAKALSRQCGGAQGLNLMTCWGAYIGNTRAERLTVYAGR